MIQNQDWARFKALGVKGLGHEGFAHWLEHAAKVVRLEAKRPRIDLAVVADRAQSHLGSAP